MKLRNERKAIERVLHVVLVLAFQVILMAAGATNLAAQNDLFNNPRNPTISPVPDGFVGTWKWNMPRQSCGSTVDSYGGTPEGGNKRANSGIPLCQWPIDQLEKFLNGRGLAWRVFTKNGADDALSPRWTCVSAGLGTVLTEGYLRTFSKRADAFVMQMEQSNWTRYIYTDGRKHAPATDAFYHGDAIGWMETHLSSRQPI